MKKFQKFLTGFLVGSMVLFFGVSQSFALTNYLDVTYDGSGAVLTGQDVLDINGEVGSVLDVAVDAIYSLINWGVLVFVDNFQVIMLFVVATVIIVFARKKLRGNGGIMK